MKTRSCFCALPQVRLICELKCGKWKAVKRLRRITSGERGRRRLFVVELEGPCHFTPHPPHFFKPFPCRLSPIRVVLCQRSVLLRQSHHRTFSDK